jgi:thiazolylpeptide-type bacteriocin precursor
MFGNTGTSFSSLAGEILELESETFEITDYADASEAMHGSSTCSSTCSSCCHTKA